MFTAQVAPYVGAWIETKSSPLAQSLTKSHPTWVRGLKLDFPTPRKMLCKSHPTWVRGLKQLMSRLTPTLLSRTLRGCVD